VRVLGPTARDRRAGARRGSEASKEGRPRLHDCRDFGRDGAPRGRALPGRSGRSRPRRVGHPRLGEATRARSWLWRWGAATLRRAKRASLSSDQTLELDHPPGAGWRSRCAVIRCRRREGPSSSSAPPGSAGANWLVPRSSCRATALGKGRIHVRDSDVQIQCSILSADPGGTYSVLSIRTANEDAGDRSLEGGLVGILRVGATPQVLQSVVAGPTDPLPAFTPAGGGRARRGGERATGQPRRGGHAAPGAGADPSERGRARAHALPGAHYGRHAEGQSSCACAIGGSARPRGREAAPSCSRRSFLPAVSTGSRP
jgi:hypothetical protein